MPRLLTQPPLAVLRGRSVRPFLFAVALLTQPPLAVLRGRTVRQFLFAVALSSLAPLPFPRAAKARLEYFLELDSAALPTSRDSSAGRASD